MTTRRLVLTWGRIDDNGNLRKHIADRNDGIILGKPAREGGGVVTGCNLEQGAGIPIGRVASPFRVKPLDPPPKPVQSHAGAHLLTTPVIPSGVMNEQTGKALF